MTELSEKQQEQVNQLRGHVADILQPGHNDEYLTKWLRARHWDMKKAEAMLRANLEWRAEHGLDSIVSNYVMPEVIRKYFPGSLCGEDKQGNPVYIDTVGRIDLKGLCYSAKKTDLVRSRMYMAEHLSQKILPQQCEKHGRQIKHCVHILDLDNFGKHHLWRPGGELYVEIIKVLEANYPETLLKSYVINAPKVFTLAFSFIKPFMSEDTISKVQILGADWKDQLLDVINKDQLPVHYGGTKTDPDGDEMCRSQVCYGGRVPKSYYRNKEELLPEGKTFQTVTVKRRSVLRLEYEVTEPECALRWVFTTDKNDIAYGVYRKTSPDQKKVSEMEPVQPTERVNCHLVPEDGLYYCETQGTYMIEFDNTFSWVRGKKLSYFVELFNAAEHRQRNMAAVEINPTRQEVETMEGDDDEFHDTD